MNRRYTAGMASIPGFQESQRFTTSDLANDDAIRTESHGGAHQAGQISVLAGTELNQILCAALDFEGVFDDHVALVRIRALDHFVNQRTAERGLARAGAAADQNILAVDDRLAENSLLRFCDNPITHIISQRVEHLGRLAHRQARPPHHRRDEPLETDAVDHKLALDNWMVGVGDCAERGGDRSDETLNLTRRDRNPASNMPLPCASNHARPSSLTRTSVIIGSASAASSCG